MVTEKQRGWYVQTRGGQEHGPIRRDELDRWVAEGRLTVDCRLMPEILHQQGVFIWSWASEIYPDLQLQTAQQPAGTRSQPVPTPADIPPKPANVPPHDSAVEPATAEPAPADPVEPAATAGPIIDVEATIDVASPPQTAAPATPAPPAAQHPPAASAPTVASEPAVESPEAKIARGVDVDPAGVGAADVDRTADVDRPAQPDGTDASDRSADLGHTTGRDLRAEDAPVAQTVPEADTEEADDDHNYPIATRPYEEDELEPHRGSTIVGLGVLGLALFPPCSIVALLLGLLDLRAMRRGWKDPSGKWITLAGTALGAVGMAAWSTLVGYILLSR